MRWHPDKNPASQKSEAEVKFKAINEAYYEALNDKKREERSMYGAHDDSRENGGGRMMRGENPTTPDRFYRHRSVDNQFYTPSYLPRSASRRSHTPSPVASPLSRSMSRRSTTTPIMFSYSNAQPQLPPIEKKLECTLEELFLGCVKSINITRNSITNTGFVTSN